MLGIGTVPVIIPPHDHVTGLDPVSVNDSDPLIALNAFCPVGIKAREMIL